MVKLCSIEAHIERVPEGKSTSSKAIPGSPGTYIYQIQPPYSPDIVSQTGVSQYHLMRPGHGSQNATARISEESSDWQ